MAAFKVIGSKADEVPYVRYSLESSFTKSFPTLPRGTEKLLRLQCITSL